MKTNCWLILGTMLATSAVAQVNTNKLPEIPPPASAPAATPAPAPTMTPAATTTSTNTVARKHVKGKKKAVKKKLVAQVSEKKTAELPAGPVTLVPGPATVAVDNVNLRGQAGLQGEVVGHAKKGDVVNVLAEINLDKPKAGEPAQWAKIALPSGTKVWIDSKYVDKTNNVVAAKKLNLRGGPGENFSVLGVIEKGASVTSVSTKGDWTQIETPASAFAFVAAHYLKQEAGMETNGTAPAIAANTENVPPPAINPAPMPTPTPTTVAEAPTIAPPATTPPPAPETAPQPAPATTAPLPAPATAAATPAAPTPAPDLTAPTPAAPDETDTNLPPPPPRIITHEGSVRPSVSPVAPTYFELFDPGTDKAIDYLYTPTTNLNLGRYNGLHIAVTGEEAMDVRWKDTPIITIQKIYVLAAEKSALKAVKNPK
jgi:pilus assembly protein FimV